MPLPTLTPIDLRSAFRPAASSTWVVTAPSPEGPVGFTAISITSVSLDPAIVSFNLSKSSGSATAITGSRRAALHLLADGQASIATRFATRRESRFVDDGAWSLDEHGLPRIHGVVTRLAVTVSDLVDAGDSHIAVCHVDSLETSDRLPLVHHDGGFHHHLTTAPNGLS